MPAFPTKDPALADHLAWLGYVQPEGLVVSAPALVDAQAIIDRAQLGDLQRRFAEQVTTLRLTDSDTGETQPGIENLQRLVTGFLGWPYELLVGVDPSRPLPESLSIALPEFQETLRPSFAVARPASAPIVNRQSPIDNSPWLLLVQGATRQSGLRWICNNHGTIYAARKRIMWPGQAAVTVSTVHLFKGSLTGPFDLDGREVATITAYLFHAGGHDNPETLKENLKKSFMGSVVVGLGFTFDDNDSKGKANSIDEMHRLVTKDEHNAERIFPYIGGDELNSSPTHTPDRYVINFGDMSESAARERWPDLMNILETKVKPERMKKAADGVAAKQKRAERWWQFSALAKDLYEAAQSLPRVLACGQTSKYRTVTFLPIRMVFDQKLIVFRFSNCSPFAVMQSRFHEA